MRGNCSSTPTSNSAIGVTRLRYGCSSSARRYLVLVATVLLATSDVAVVAATASATRHCQTAFSLASSQRRSKTSFSRNGHPCRMPHRRHAKAAELAKIAAFALFSQPSTVATVATATRDAATAATAPLAKTKIPIHLLAGFLGAGKTTVLKHVLENTEGLRVGVVVNDVAAVNIDAKLVKQSSTSTSSSSSSSTLEAASKSNDHAIVELQNGCACCSLADELFTSLERLLQVAPATQQEASDHEANDTIAPSKPFDAILVELSGVADPVAIQNNWQQAVAQQYCPTVTFAAQLQNVITVVDACTFGTDYMTWDTAGDRPVWFGASSSDEAAAAAGCTVNRKVVELLAEQVEAANIVVLNKQDLATPEQVQVARSMVQSLNDKLTSDNAIITTSFGKVSVTELLQTSSSDSSNTIDESSTTAVPVEASSCIDSECSDPTHAHLHDHHHAKETSTTAADSDCSDATCNDTSHSHSHSHDHVESTSAVDVKDCSDSNCNDPSHSHSHNAHNHESKESTKTATASTPATATSLDNLGISNFVYKATRPFNANRLMQLLYQWPVPIKDELDLSLLQEAASDGYSIRGQDATGEGNDITSPFVGALRSKGFCWFAPVSWMKDPKAAVMVSQQDKDKGNMVEDDSWRHDTAMYWSHAGRHLGMTEAGRWWSSVVDATAKDGSDGSVETMKQFFQHDLAEKERVLREDFVTTEFGDRRQELVFIGVALQEEAIRQALDACLLTELEMASYRHFVQSVVEVPITMETSSSP